MKMIQKKSKWIFPVLALLIVASIVGICLSVSDVMGSKSQEQEIKDVFAGAVLAGDGLHAYLSDSENASNKVTVGSVETRIVEDFVPPSKLSAGVSFKKDVKIENSGDNACFVRIKAVFTDSDIEKLCEVDWNNTDFIYNESDGFWYYPSVLEAGATTPSLFTSVKVVETLTLDDGTGTMVTISVTNEMMKDFDIIVYQEAYQAACNTGDYDTDENGYFVNYQDAWAKYQENKPT